MVDEVTPESTDQESVGTETEAVEIETASDAELDAFLKGEPVESEEVAASEPDVPTQESSDEKQVPEKQEPKKAESAEEVKLSRAEWERYQAELDKSKRQIEQQERFIQHRNTEVGNLRKQLREQAEALDERLGDDEFRDDPVAVAKAVAAKEKIEDNIRQLDQEEQQNTLYLHTVKQLEQVLKPEDGIGVDQFVESLRREGVSDVHLQEFARNPVGWVGNPVAFRFLAGKVKAEHYAKQLYKYATALKSENEKLREKSSQTATQTAASISRALKSPPPISASAPARTSQGRFSANPATLGDDEIESFLQRAKR